MIDERLGLLELDVDLRLLDLYEEAMGIDLDETNWDRLSAFMRAAYGAGYRDALVEPVRGQLHRDHGYCVPERRAA